MLLRKLLCLLAVSCFSLITFSSFAALDEPPKNTLVFSEEFENIADNSWSNLEFLNDKQPAGLYYIELSELLGTVGCWGSKKNTYEDGMAWKDDVPWDNNEDSDFRN